MGDGVLVYIKIDPARLNRVEDKKHCCEAMTYQLNLRCKQHPDRFDCANNLIDYVEQLDESGIILHDGGSSYSVIHYCPWCGTKLPESKREM